MLCVMRVAGIGRLQPFTIDSFRRKAAAQHESLDLEVGNLAFPTRLREPSRRFES
jgi:hypothetical protein